MSAPLLHLLPVWAELENTVENTRRRCTQRGTAILGKETRRTSHTAMRCLFQPIGLKCKDSPGSTHCQIIRIPLSPTSKSRKWLPCFQHPTEWTVKHKHGWTFTSETNLYNNPLQKPSNCSLLCARLWEHSENGYRTVKKDTTRIDRQNLSFVFCRCTHHTSQVQHHETHWHQSQPQEKDFQEGDIHNSPHGLDRHWLEQVRPPPCGVYTESSGGEQRQGQRLGAVCLSIGRGARLLL